MVIETVKGFRDILSLEALKRKKLKEIIENKFILYGFSPIETPSIEYEELLKSSEDEVVSDIFKLQDKGQRKLALRYEFTGQLARIFKENSTIKLPFKRYQIGSVFRDEPAKPGRYREFTQCDVDIIGDSNISADAECLALANDIFNELKIKVNIKINNRKLLNSIIKSLNISEISSVIREVDKLDKLPLEEVKNNISKLANKEKTDKLFLLFKKDIDYFVKNNFEGASELKELMNLCNNYKIKVEFIPSLARGFSYYTGNVWEIKSEKAKFTITAGGRYDKVVGKYLNREIPAVGISFGLDRISEIVDIKPEPTKVLIISLNEDKESINLIKKLRESNISCSIMFGKISKAMEYANSYNIQNVIFVGKEEIKKKKFKLRDMKTGKESYFALTGIIKKLK
ncbi:MAG: histidine--tRNA ligase [Candidatus Nanoarchaeia archaeon]|nr:histidine--tRNA ligase [Candidatus Nanoarchaeia archaeon]